MAYDFPTLQRQCSEDLFSTAEHSKDVRQGKRGSREGEEMGERVGCLEYSAKDEEWGKKLPGKWNSQGSHHTVGHQASLSDGLWLGLSIRV